jgi:hypothetical protein
MLLAADERRLTPMKTKSFIGVHRRLSAAQSFICSFLGSCGPR